MDQTPTAAALSRDTTDAPAASLFVGALRRRDFTALEASLAPHARARFLLPPGEEEYDSATAIRRRIESWYSAATTFHMIADSDEPIGPRRRLTWRLRLTFDPDGAQGQLVEQVAFVDVGVQGIEQIDLLCSGFQPDASRDPDSVVIYDAGDRGCADGLAQEFRRQVDALPRGATLVSVVRDPAAKADLPPLARMLGHAVRSVESEPGGVVRIAVEKMR